MEIMKNVLRILLFMIVLVIGSNVGTMAADVTTEKADVYVVLNDVQDCDVTPVLTSHLITYELGNVINENLRECDLIESHILMADRVKVRPPDGRYLNLIDNYNHNRYLAKAIDKGNKYLARSRLMYS